jgi:ADP-ribosylglycohydrolase
VLKYQSLPYGETFRWWFSSRVSEPYYSFDVSCQGSVPESIIAFLDSDSFMDAIKNAISLGGDADTMACIAGGIAQAWYKKIPEKVVTAVREKLAPDLREILDRFNETYGCEF